MRGRKTSIALEFARMQQNAYSIFWIVAENLDTLQCWYERASLCIAPDKVGEDSRDHYHAVTQWLLHPANGKWILIFDNAHSELNYGDILPGNVPWGKTIFTSRTKNIVVETKQPSNQLIILSMPLLSREKAVAIFTLRRTDVEFTQA